MDEHVRAGDRLAPLRLIPAETKVRFGWVLLCATLGLLAGGCDGATDGLKGAADGGDKECIPQTCRDLDFACGTFDDGCGGRVNCEESCGCTEENFREVCPDRPCEIVFGCFSGQCAYRPVTCDDEDCLARPCEGEGCELICSQQGCDEGLYPCSQSQRVCAGVRRYCDPAPRLVGGQILYQNECIPAPKRGCGTCELGAVVCDEENDGFICEQAPLPAGTSCSEDFIYVDPTYSEGRSDGSKAKPFVKYEQALATAEATGTSVIIIGGSPTFTQRLEIKDGISVYGGFTTHPEFKPDPSARPTWRIPATSSAVTDGRLVGMVAREIETPTVIRGLRIETGNASALQDASGQGISNFAVLIESSRKLSLINNEFVAGRAGNGAHGADGAAPTNAMRGGDGGVAGQVYAPGMPPSACPRAEDSAGCTLSPLPEDGVRRTRGVCEQPETVCELTCTRYDCVDPNYPGQHFLNPNGFRVTASAWPLHESYPRTCGRGGEADFVCSTTYRNLFGNRGGDHGPFGGLSGDSGAEEYDSVPEDGADGDDGAPGADGADGSHSSKAALDPNGHWGAAEKASGGEPGYRGTWGGGGGAGGNYRTYTSGHYRGGHGGGAGAPGCGGHPGEAGQLGGASIGLVIVNSDMLQIEANRIEAAHGGDGGNGGRGGEGGEGGEGGKGEADAAPSSARCGWHATRCTGSICPGKGGDGGKGGSGGRGGDAGGGAGGDSSAIQCAGYTELDVHALENRNALAIGSGGMGGVRGGNPADRAPSGDAVRIKGCPSSP